MLIARRSLKGAASRPHQRHRQAVSEKIVGAGDGPHVRFMDFQLTPEQELIRASARELCARELVPHARAWDEAEELPRALVGTLAEAGFLAAGLPEELGGGGLDSVSYCLLCEELGKADSSVRGIVSVSNGLFGKTVAKWGTDAQKRRAAAGARERRAARLLRADRARAAAPTRRRSRRVRSVTATAGCSPARRSSSRSAPGRRPRSSSPAPAATARRGSARSSCRRTPTGSRRGR